MTTDVFISYSSANKEVADAVCNALETHGISCWIAPRNIMPGSDWSASIIGALNECRLFVLVLTEQSNLSPQVKREVERVVHKDVPIIAFRVENVALTPSLEYFISASHWLDATVRPLDGPLAHLADAAQRYLLSGADAAAAYRAPSPPSEAGVSIPVAAVAPVSAPPVAVAPESAPLAAMPLPGNLPAPVTTFVGRAEEIAQLDALLSGGARLVTLTGPGGIGKTRLALRVAGERREHYPGGLWWVDMAALQDPALAVPTIAATLGIREQPGADLPAQIAARIAAAPTLIIIDNFEQIVAAAEEVDSLLRVCLLLTLMVTSRAALNLSCEYEFALAEMDEASALALFMARAQQARAQFTLDDKGRPVVARICRRLDGIPLAIELAAAQVKMLTLAQIEKQLDQRFRVLVSPYKDVTQRQRTLRATIDWSYNLLSEEERSLFAALSIFPASFTLDDADALCQEPDGVYFGMMRLREQSLLRMMESEDEPRFVMLETLQSYGQEQLRARGRLEELADRHAAYYGEIAIRYGQTLAATGDAEAYATLRKQADNLRAALERDWEKRRTDEAAAICANLGEFWERQGWLREGRANLERCLRPDSTPNDPVLLARLLNTAGWLAFLQADYTEAGMRAQRALEVSQQAGALETETTALNNLALIAQAQYRNAEALDLFRRALDAARGLEDDRKVAARLSNMGLLEAACGNLEQAQKYLEEARAIYEKRHDTRGLAGGLCNLSDLALRRQQWVEAEVLAKRSLDCFRELSDRMGMACALANIAESAAWQEHYEVAEQATDEGLTLCAEADLLWLIPILLKSRACSRFSRQQWRNAAHAFSVAEQLRVVSNNPRDPEEAQEFAPLIAQLAEHEADREMVAWRASLVGMSSDELVAQALLTTQGLPPE